MAKPVLSVVAPVYNEEKGIGEFYGRLKNVLRSAELAHEIIFINDGSTDATPLLLDDIKRADSEVRVLHFSRNFGHQIAIKAGIDHARGDAVVTLDTDLQDPPESIPRLLAKWQEGYDVVYAVRAKRAGESVFKKVTASLYYKMLRRLSSVDIPLDAGDFRLISARVAAVVRGVREQHPYLRGLISWAGFRQIGVSIDRQPRFAGKTKYSLQKMMHLAWSGVAHFSFWPLQLATWSGIFVMVLSALWFGNALFLRYARGETDVFSGMGFAALFFIGGVQLVSIGILGSYVARNYDETRSRPLYVLKEDTLENP